MPLKEISPFVVFSLLSVCSGCTTYEINPQIQSDNRSAIGQEVSGFTFDIGSPWENTRFGKIAYEATALIIPRAQDVSDAAAVMSGQMLEIKISEQPSGGACAQEYLTGLSLGLIPSMCTRNEMYKFSFVLTNNGYVCSYKSYIVNSKTFSHILALPFAVLNNDDGPIKLYRLALVDFIGQGKCATIAGG